MINSLARQAGRDEHALQEHAHSGALVRRASLGNAPQTLADIYREDVNLAVWRRSLDQETASGVGAFLDAHRQFQASLTVPLERAEDCLKETLGQNTSNALVTDIVELVDMYCCLFDLRRVGLRLTVLDRAMCPRFHVDQVPCRLITTYTGRATEWLAQDGTQEVDRSKLGRGAQGLADHESGLYRAANQVQGISEADVALLKGERWEGNEGGGLVHRSPALQTGERRLLLTLDFSN